MRNEIKIDEELYHVYPQIRLGILQFETNVQEPNEQFWQYMNNMVLPKIRETIAGKEWKDITGVKGSRAAYKAFGRDPGRYRVSSEALLRRIRRGEKLYRINSVVDVNNLISVESGLSVGSYDLNKIKGPITFRKAEKGEGYDAIGKGFLDMENMLTLADDTGIFGSSMSDSVRTMVTDTTRDVLAVIYCFEENIDLEGLLAQAQSAFKEYAFAENIEEMIV